MEVQPVFLDKLSTEIHVSYILEISCIYYCELETEKRGDGVGIRFFFTVNILLLRWIELHAEVD